MSTKVLFFALIIGALICISSPSARATSCVDLVGNGCVIGGANVPCVGEFDCIPEGPFLILCHIMTYLCPPAAGAAETCPHCPSGGKPISLAGGNTFIEQADIKIPGLGGGLSLVRTWNSVWPSTQSTFKIGLFGPSWRSNFEERVFVGSDNYVKYARGDGSFWSFGYSSSGQWRTAAPANVAATLSAGVTYWTLVLPNGETRLFDNQSGNLISIADRNGNTTLLSYDAIDRLATVTDPAGRHLYFSYANDSSYLVTAVTSDFGISLSYTYDVQGRMTTLTKPDQSTISFEYDTNSLITAVKDSSGKILESHTYDGSGRGLTSSQANGVGAITVTYPN